MTTLEHFTEILLMGFCIWSLIWLLVHLSVMRFIVPRYEKETGLIDTLYFKEFMPFAKYIPSFWSSIFYIFHLTNFIWFWRWVKDSKIYRDIDRAEDVIDKFTVKEIRRIKLQIFLMIIAVSHVLAVSIIEW